jgi:hypothetical protein
MKKVLLAFITLALGCSFGWAYYLFAEAVLAQSVSRMDSTGGWGLSAGIAYLIWLSIFAGNAFGLSYAPGSKLSRAAQSNLKASIISLVLCFPTAFIFIGLIAPPFIIGLSAIALAIAIVVFKNHEAQPLDSSSP